MEDVTLLIERSQKGDKAAREQLVEQNLGLVHHIVKRFAGRGHDMEDLFQIGAIGLMKAIDKFDLSYEVKFSTYAVPLIVGEIKRFLRDDGMLKVSRTLKENGLKVKMAMERLNSRLGREPLLEEVSREAELTVEEVTMALAAGAEVESLYKSVPQSDGGETFLVDKIAYGGGGSAGACIGSGGYVKEDCEKEELLNHMLVGQLLDALPEKERSLITMRYFQDKTQSEVARCMGISQVQVSRMEKKILLQLREEVIS